MSRTWVWVLTALSAALLATAGVTLGVRLGNAGSGAAREACAGQLEAARVEVAHLRRLVDAYRDREAVYRQRLQEANRILAAGDRRRGGEERREGGSIGGHEEWEHEGRD